MKESGWLWPDDIIWSIWQPIYLSDLFSKSNSWFLKDKYLLTEVRVNHDFCQATVNNLRAFFFLFFFFLKPGLFHVLGTLLVLPESMSLELKFLKHQIKSFVCSFLHGYHYYYSGLTSIWSETVLKEPFACAFWVQQNLLTLKDAGRKSQCRKG